MKELWIRTEESALELIKLATQVCDVVLVDGQDVENAGKAEIKIASALGNGDLHVLNDFDEDKVAKLKNSGKAVAVRIIIKEEMTRKLLSKPPNFQLIT